MIKFASTTPFIAVLILGIAIFSANPLPAQRMNLAEWKSNQQILLFIENCQDGQLGLDECKMQIPIMLDQCKTFHVLACDDERLGQILNTDHVRMTTGD